ncbi:MAG: peptidylprolyl isomerase [Holophagales bacterium]|jgi:peptidyl-prolyl cis-trans isomerase D|nr:peptidylprolyl isomerase [Holophagales bacterium]
MLRDFRKVIKSSKGLTGSLMIVLSLAFLAYLGTAFQTTHPDSPEVVLARVYGRDVRRRDLNEAMQRMIQQFGARDNLESMMPFIQQQALSQLMNLKLTEELADRHGVVVTDAEVRDSLAAELRTIPLLLDANGQLLPVAEIRSLLAQYFNVSLKNFEESVRSNLIIGKLQSQAAALTPIDEAWLNEEYRARNEKISFESVSLSPATMAVPDPGDEVLDTFLKASGDRFQQGPRRVLQIVSVDQSNFGDSLVPDETTLQSAFDAKKSGYLEIRASHILVRGTTPEELEAAQEKLNKIRAKLVAGADFASLAEAESEDPSAKANKGDLGWFRDGVMDKGFWDGAVALNKGEVSQPVKSMYGLHLIKLHDRRDRSFDEVKQELTSEIINERFSAKAKEKLEQLRKRVGEKGDLSAAAASLGLKVTNSDPFSSDAPTVTGLEAIRSLVSDAFSMSVGQVSQIVSASGRFIVYRVHRELPIAVPPLKEIRTKVLDAYRLEEARNKLLTMFNDAEGYLSTIGPIEVKAGQTFAEMSDFADNSLARQTVLETPAGSLTKAVWTKDGKLWMARIKERVPPAPITAGQRTELIKDIQSKESMKLLEAELKDLSNKGNMRMGFNSLWGRLNGIYVNDDALKSRTADPFDE